MSQALLSRRAIVILSLVTAVSFATTLGLTVFDDGLGRASSGTDGFSPSAVGHQAFVDFLRRLGVPVTLSRHSTAKRVPSSSLLIVAEPDLSGGTDRKALFREMLHHEGPVLVVLPKRDANPSPHDPGWVESAPPRPIAVPQAVLDVIDLDFVVLRPKTTTPPWHSRRLEASPALIAPAQLIEPVSGLRPMVSCDEGLLVATVEAGRGEITVLSDPDVLSGQGLHRGENALLLARLIDRLRPEGGAVVLDETLHGFAMTPSVWHELLTWPLVLPVGLAFLAAGILAWAGFGRFGAPRPQPPPIGPGKGFLIENTAELLRFGGHSAHALDRYLATTIQDVARATHVPPGLNAKATTEWLERVGATRGVERGLSDLATNVKGAAARGPRGVLGVAMQVHGWRKEMTDGPRDDS